MRNRSFQILATAVIGLALFAADAVAAPFIQNTALQSCRALGPAGQVAPGTALFRVDVDTAVYPDATCNDGSGAVMYVRRARQPQFRNKWVIFLQGGGGCRDGQTCGERYCSVDTNFGAWKMSSLDVPAFGIAGGGIQSQRPQNRFRGWNHVHVHYCSSDGWGGTASDVDLQMVDNAGNTIDYRVNFHGAHIVDAVIDTLRRANGPVQYVDDRERRRTMPDLDEAQLVLFAGSSAGSGGVRRNADLVRDVLEMNNVNCQGPGVCPLDFRAVVDAGTGPRMEDYGYGSATFCTGAGICTYDDLMMDAWFNTSAMWGERTDASCLAYHAGGDEWMCADTQHILENHIHTPFFVRMDLQDQLIMNNAVDAMLEISGTLVDFNLWGLGALDNQIDLLNLNATAEEGSVLGAGPVMATPGLFSPQCGNHESMRNSSAFLRVRAPVYPAGGASMTTNRAMVNWVLGGGPIHALVPFAGPGILPSCP